VNELTRMTPAAIDLRGAPIEGTIGLVLANLAALVTALWFDWPPTALLWPYLLQSLVIGGFAVRRMLTAPRICTKGLTSNGKQVPATRAGRISTATFFTFHYGFFHLIYAVFIGGWGSWPQGMDLWATLALVATFAWGHANSYRRNRSVEDEVPANLGTLMFLPYLRVIPMHLTILFGGLAFGGGGTWALLLFTLLKTASDVAMHYAEHAILRKEQSAAGGDARED
jgi:hypothetical protein